MDFTKPDKWTWFDYKPVCSQFATTHYVAAYKTIYMYYLKKSHDSLNRSYDYRTRGRFY